MTVKEVFDLRKQGRIEEAYEAIRPMYAVHKGKYTTLCMFWTASDILKKRLKEKRTDEAVMIFRALLRILPNIDDSDRKAHTAIYREAVMLAKEQTDDAGRRQQTKHAATDSEQPRPTFSMLDFLEQLNVEDLNEEDWKATNVAPTDGQPGHPIPSVAQQMLTCAFHEIQQHPDVDNALKAMPLLQEAVRRHPYDKNNLRHIAVVYTIMGENEKAVGTYRQLLARFHDSYLYAELAKLTDSPGQKAALYCRAIQNQRQEKFKTAYRLELARLLAERDKPKAAHELKKCVDTRMALGLGINRSIQTLQQQLQGITPATDSEQQTFYRKMMGKYPI